MYSRAAARLFALTLISVIAVLRPITAADNFALTLFEQYVESLRKAAAIPAISAVIVQKGEVVWERGFGFQDVENNIRARSDTPYPIGGVTQVLTATLVLQCTERGTLELDERMSEFSNRVPATDARVRHVLSHTSEATPGDRFKYDLSRYAALTEVSNKCSGVGLPKVLVRGLFERLGMFDSVPGADSLNPSVIPSGTFDPEWDDRFKRTLERIAVPYKLNRKSEPVRSERTQTSLDTATGVISTARDLSRFEQAIVEPDLLLLPETFSLAWTNTRSTSGASLPFGLGWFVQNYEGQKVVWAFGSMDEGYSSLFVRIPARNLTLIMLANSDGLGAQLAAGDVTASPFARVFLKLFP